MRDLEKRSYTNEPVGDEGENGVVVEQEEEEGAVEVKGAHEVEVPKWIDLVMVYSGR